MHRALLTFALCLGLATTAQATPLVNTAYELRLDGLMVGTARVTAEGGADTYRIDVAMDWWVIFWSGTLTAHAEGQLVKEAPRPDVYRLTSRGSRERRVEVAFVKGDATRIAVDPPLDDEGWVQGRVPLGPTDLRAVRDPLSAILAHAIRASAASPETTCRGSDAVLTGLSHFDLALEPASAGNRSEVVCRVHYRPVAGHKPDSIWVQRLAASDRILVAFDRADGTLRLPRRISLPSLLGELTLDRRS
jgi:hypothetical protein